MTLHERNRIVHSTLFTLLSLAWVTVAQVNAAEMRAGVAKVDITDMDAGPVNDRLYVRALVLTDGNTTAAIIAVDAVAIGEIGHIGNDYLGKVRSRINTEFGIEPEHVLINASHCHGVVCDDVEQRTFQAVQEATAKMVPVRVGAGVGHEDRIMENRRLQLNDGTEADVRHAYALPPDEVVAGVGPVDPEIGVLLLERSDGRTLAVVYNFACHPIQGVPGGGNTADITGYASRVIEENSSEGTVALFLQGCAGDVNPVWYKDVHHPRDAEPLGNALGLSTLKALKNIECEEIKRLTAINEHLALPRGDMAPRILQLEALQHRLLKSLKGTSLNLKTFIPLVVKYNLSSEFPSYDSHRYLHDEAMNRNDLKKLDSDNRNKMARYIRNILIMEELTRNQTNLALLRKHQASHLAASGRAINVELMGLRIGNFVLLSFPGELAVEIGLNIKKRSPHEFTFVAGYSNGYIYYAPTSRQLRNAGSAQEDCDCLLAPEWQELFELKAADMLSRL